VKPLRIFRGFERERKRVIAEVLQVRGLMPLLMKPRNGQPWSPADRAKLRLHFQRLGAVSPYLVVLVLPASFVTLPLLAWWLDRRRLRRASQQAGATLP
jgi:hypothetical protein